MASQTQWTWVWVNSGSWWWTGKPGVLQFMPSQRVRPDWVTGLNWTELRLPISPNIAWILVSLFCSNCIIAVFYWASSRVTIVSWVPVHGLKETLEHSLQVLLFLVSWPQISIFPNPLSFTSQPRRAIVGLIVTKQKLSSESLDSCGLIYWIFL